MSNRKGRKGPTGLTGKRINGTTASSVRCPVPVRESDSVLFVPLREDRYNRFYRCLQGPLAPLGLFALRLHSPFLAWDTTDKHRHPRQGQYTGQSTVLSVSEIFWWKVWRSQCPTSVLRCLRCLWVGGGTLEWLGNREDAEKIFR